MYMMLAVALVVPWIFWGILTGILIATGRSWMYMLLIPACITAVIQAIAGLSSIRNAFWISLVLHLILLVIFTGHMSLSCSGIDSKTRGHDT